MRDESRTIGEWIYKAAQELRANGVELPERTAEWLWLFATKMERIELLMQWGNPALPEQASAFWQLVLRRAMREPLQYIVGETEFAGLSFAVDARVLIPRADTEVLVHAAINKMEHALGGVHGRPLTVVDVGTGSGVIAISLARALQARKIAAASVTLYATDISSDALVVARRNAAQHGVAPWIKFVQGSYLDAVAQTADPLDLIVSNPPYIAEGERTTLQPEVSGFEPSQALFAGPDGLQAYRELAHAARDRLAYGGAILFEVGTGQARAVADILLATWPDIHTETVPDQQNIERVVIAQRLEVC